MWRYWPYRSPQCSVVSKCVCEPYHAELTASLVEGRKKNDNPYHPLRRLPSKAHTGRWCTCIGKRQCRIHRNWTDERKKCPSWSHMCQALLPHVLEVNRPILADGKCARYWRHYTTTVESNLWLPFIQTLRMGPSVDLKHRYATTVDTNKQWVFRSIFLW